MPGIGTSGLTRGMRLFYPIRVETGFGKGERLHFCPVAEETPGEVGKQDQAIAEQHESIQDEKDKLGFHYRLHQKQNARPPAGGLANAESAQATGSLP